MDNESRYKEYNELVEADRRFVWHPFTQMRDWMDEDSLIIVEGRDCFVRDIRGRWYLDGVSSLWVNIHGHRKPELDRAIKEQLDRIAHATMLGAATEPAIRLAERIAGYTMRNLGAPLHKVFYSDNGSTAVEVALKMAFQYWRHRGVAAKEKFLSLDLAYHGDTLGAVSVGGVDIFHGAFGPLLFGALRAPAPYCYRCKLSDDPRRCGLQCLHSVEAILRAHAGEIAAFIVEPLIQAAGGMIVWPRGYLRGVRDLCSKYDVLLVCDEVATGFGRTGRMFASEHEGVMPDIICLSKGITGGYMPLAVTIATEDIFNAFLGEFSEMKTFFHGHSYTGNPLACACALASLDVFETEGVLERTGRNAAILRDWLSEVVLNPHVGDSRGIGLVGAVELVRDKKTREPYGWEERIGWAVAGAAREAGVLIRPLGNVIVIMPPLAISAENLAQMLRVIDAAIKKVT